MSANPEMLNVNTDRLLAALSRQFESEIVDADYQATALQGGTIASVYLLTGTARTADGRRLPYRIVLKVQKKWERYGDPNSWRREYDLYASDLAETFSDGVRWPVCYLAEMNDDTDEFRLWLEYADGVSGANLTAEMYEQAALEWGRYQGKLYRERPTVLDSLTNLSTADLMKKTYLHYRSWPVVHDYIRSEECELPRHLSGMMIEIDAHSDEIFARIESLPLVLCHRDFWSTNVIYTEGKVRLIDWDTAGWGYPGEDIASLIADETENDVMVECYRRCVPAYHRAFAEQAQIPYIEDDCVYEMILIVFGYRLIESYLHSEDERDKQLAVRTLENIYAMKNGFAPN